MTSRPVVGEKGLAGRKLFQGLNARQRLNLVLTATATFLVIFGLWYVGSGGWRDFLGADYRAFYASAQIARQYGFSPVYDLDLQDDFQRPLLAETASSRPYAPYPMPYLPVFVLPFLPFTVLPFLPSFFCWVGLNLAALLLYLRRFAGALDYPRGQKTFLRMLPCLPVFSDLFAGQVNVWLLIFLGEFFLAQTRVAPGKARQAEPSPTRRSCFGKMGALICSFLREPQFRSGLWLGGLLLKPQTLVLLLPGLLLGRRFKAVAGFAVAGLFLVGFSLLLAGPAGLLGFGRLILLYAGGVQTSFPEVMVNWRSLAINLLPVIPPQAAWSLAALGIALTAGAGLSLWVRPFEAASSRGSLVLLGTYAATCAVTWHAHMDMMMPLIPLFLALNRDRPLPWALMGLWLFGPLATAIGGVLIRPDLGDNLAGLGMLVLNLYVVAWTARTAWRTPVFAGESDP